MVKKTILLISFIMFYSALAFSNSIDVVLVGYEDKKDYEDNPTCELEFTFNNNSWGTLYQIEIETNVLDDRGDKVDDYGFSDKIKAFELFSDINNIKVGNSATFKSLHLDGKCQYLKDIYLTEVKPEKCNIRMMPEDGDCLKIINPISRIDHINLINEFSNVAFTDSSSSTTTSNSSSIEPLYFAVDVDMMGDLMYDQDPAIKKLLGTNIGREIVIDDLYIWSYQDDRYIKGGPLELWSDDSMGSDTRISCAVSPEVGDKFMVNRMRQSLQISGRIKSYDDYSGLLIEPCNVLNTIQ